MGRKYQLVDVVPAGSGLYDVEVWGKNSGSVKHVGRAPTEVAEILKRPPTFKQVRWMNESRNVVSVPDDLKAAVEAAGIPLGGMRGDCTTCRGTGQVDGTPCPTCQVGW